MNNMMHKIVATLILAGLSCPASGQVIIALVFGEKLNTEKMEFGIVASPTLTNITNQESQYRTGLNLGLYLNFRPDKRFFLHVEGIAKGSFGAEDIKPYPTQNDTLDNLFASGSIHRKIKTFGLPVLGSYHLTELFFAEAGIQANMRLKVKDQFKTEVMDNDLEYTVDVTKQFTWLDFGLTGGLFYKFRKDRKSMGMGVRYFYGLTDIDKVAKGNQSNSAWLLNITIPVGAGKAEEEKKAP
jgi:hypothetical protein